MTSSISNVPDEYICPITRCIMENPVILIEDGCTYDESALQLWLRDNNRSPMTNKQLTTRNYIPNRSLKSLIEEFSRAQTSRVHMSDFFTFSIRTGKHLQRDWIQRPTIKIILSLLGASAVGKTCLALCLRHGRLPANLKHTSSSCGIESHFYYLDRLFQNNYVVDIHLNDPPGQEKYESVTNDIFRRCHGALLLADTTKIDTLERLEHYWYTKLESMAVNNVQSVLVCTKIDLFEKKNQEYRQSFLQRAENFASLHQIPMIQVSAYRDNVEHIFKQLIVRILGDETITNDLISKATIPSDLINQRRNTITHSNLTPLGYSTSDHHRPRKCCH